MKRVFPWILFILMYLGLRIYYLDLVPIWDGLGYYKLLASSISGVQPFIEKYSLVGHTSLAWALLCSIPIRLFPENIIAFNSFLLGFDCLVVFAFYRLIRFFAPISSTEIEKVLIVSCFAFNPVILATQLNFSVDTGLLSFFVIYLFLWVERKYLWAALIACLMSLTKEPGIIICLIFPILEISSYFLNKNHKQKDKLSLYWLLIGLPLVSFVSVVYLKNLSPSHHLFWEDNPMSIKDTIWLFLNPFAPQIKAVNNQQDFLSFIFIANFSWVMVSFLFLFVSVRLWRKFHLNLNPINSKHFHLWLALFPITYLLTRFPTFLHARYVSTIIVIIIVLFWCEIVKVVHSSKIRTIILGIVFVFQIDAACFSHDPVTSTIFGRFPMGNGQFYCLCTGEDKTWLRDVAVYNLQFAQLSRAIDSALVMIKPNSNTIISMHEAMLFAGRTFGSLNSSNYRRTVNSKNTILPRYLSAPDVESSVKAGGLIGPVWYIAFPNTNCTEDLRTLIPLFRKLTVVQRMDHRHSLSLYKFEDPISRER